MTSFLIAKYKRNLLEEYNNASAAALKAGMEAYPTYAQKLRELAELHGFGFVQTVEAFVTLSPSNDYIGNMRSLVSCMTCPEGKSPIITTFNRCGAAAVKILNGEISFLDTTKGPKIRAFRENILYPETAKTPVIDGHMIAAALQEDNMNMKQANLALRSAGGFSCFAKGARNAARSIQLPISVFQATVWYARKIRLRIVSLDLEQKDLFADEFGPYKAEEFLPYGFR